MYFPRFRLPLPMKEEIINVKKRGNNIFKVCISLILGGSILYWMYRDFNFKQVESILFNEMNWTWMLLSFPFGILAQAFRGWRWKLALKPIGENPRTSTTLNSIFLSYAVSLAIPRIGEFARCIVLKRYDNISFPKALGTVVTERIIDTLIIMLVAIVTFILHIPIFNKFFAHTGTSLDSILKSFSPTGYLVTAICGLSVLWLVYYLIRRLSIYNKVKDTLHGIWQGIASLKNVENAPLYILMSFAIWGCYFLHHYLAFFCFDATSHLGFSCGLVTFIVGSFAVIVPTPNGAGPWHFAVKTMLILYGVADNDALFFVLVVHAVQTLLVVLVGIYAWLRLMFTQKKEAPISNEFINNNPNNSRDMV